MNPLLPSIKALFAEYNVEHTTRTSIYASQFGELFVEFMEKLLTLIATTAPSPECNYTVTSNLLLEHIPDILKIQVPKTKYFTVRDHEDDFSVYCFAYSGATAHLGIDTSVYLQDYTFTVGQIFNDRWYSKIYRITEEVKHSDVNKSFMELNGRLPDAIEVMQLIIDSGFAEVVDDIITIDESHPRGRNLNTKDGVITNSPREHKQDGKWGRL